MRLLTEKDKEFLSETRRSRTIGVLMGGPSEERDISLKSGSAVLTHLAEAEYHAEPCDFRTEEELRAQLKEKKIAFAFIALHGRFGEDGEVQTLLESMKIPYTGSSASASRLSFDKWESRKAFQKKGLLTPHDLLLTGSDPLPSALQYPLVVKPVCQGSSIGLSIVDHPDELRQAVQKAFEHDRRILIEEYISGSELTVGILGEEALPVIQILPANRCYDYDAKYMSDLTQFWIPAPIDDAQSRRIQKTAKDAHEAVGCDSFSRVNLLLNKQGDPVVLEVNTIPGLTSRSLLPRSCEAAGISFLELCERMILLSYLKGERRIHA